MKSVIKIFFLFVAVILASCSGKSKSSDVTYEYIEKTRELSPELQEKIGAWADEGADCFGIIALIDQQGVMQEGAAIEARIVRFNGDSVKMKSLQTLNLREVEGCDKMGISRGDTWWETAGDIYKTKEEAEARVKEALNEAKIRI